MTMPHQYHYAEAMKRVETIERMLLMVRGVATFLHSRGEGDVAIASLLLQEIEKGDIAVRNLRRELTALRNLADPNEPNELPF